ncbi:putative PurR-regulated permease PerM [Rhodovulum imhoffii]|uniref:Putative PurR-regulated permease PerM n=1 Tax=Rhodovulum imhoffii TaxID=365340 RepID=A0A2T5BW70_9RHOB|nr:AI-2E family transporter [Rhodovulum imhoffii]MBK5935149.1 AI-2E family transporter [Rhodovulum imhoffii]PTN03884.1 putative PurR-regulated permease PerM [Rhodovulum imhoffii]
MGLPIRDQIKYWGIAMAVFLALVWVLGDVILPFVVGMAVAYVLDPVADRLENAGLSRIWATVTITAGALVVFSLVMTLVVPVLVEQATALVNAAPDLARNFQSFVTRHFPSLDQDGSALRTALVQVGETIKARGGELLNRLASSAAGVVNIVVISVLVPVITFYLLMDWDRMVAEIDRLLPRDHAPVIRRLAGEIDATLASFIRGQGTVCLILGSYYALALGVLGLQFGLIVGMFAGLISFIPYVGSIFGGALALGLALFQFWGDWWMILAVAGVFLSGQLVEGNFLTPKLVGKSVGLHPVWLIFALSVFGAAFGFVGMLIAVPVAASIGVLTRFAISQYLNSRLYRGLSGKPPPEEE